MAKKAGKTKVTPGQKVRGKKGEPKRISGICPICGESGLLGQPCLRKRCYGSYE